MAVRSEREKSKMQERYQMILSQMLKEEDNRYCVDCDAKSPRWASWNIGVFICIRCAGFHRNLGVHISKVKSVNLDSWTGEQISAMQVMGNSRARAVYEANLPDGFRRPQSDSALEAFIRAKYEQRKWIAKEWIPPEITLIESETNQRQTDSAASTTSVEKTSSKIKPFTVPIATNNPVRQTVPTSPPCINSPTEEPNTQNLLNLNDLPVSYAEKPASSTYLDPLHDIFTTTVTNKNEATGELPGIDKDLESAFTSPNGPATKNDGVMSNEKIMALFNQPQTSVTTPLGTNIRPIPHQLSHLSSSGFAYPPSAQHSQFVPPQKSVSVSSNLYQHAMSTGSQMRQSVPFHAEMNGNPSPTFSHNQFMPFANAKSNTPTGTFTSHVPMHPVAEYIPTPSDSLW